MLPPSGVDLGSGLNIDDWRDRLFLYPWAMAREPRIKPAWLRVYSKIVRSAAALRLRRCAGRHG